MNSRLQFLDYARGIAVLLVAYGHLVSVATRAPKIPSVFPSNADLPILDASSHSLWMLERLFYKYIGAQTAIVGVLLFL